MEPIDVVMLTKNSEYTLAECLQSIYENVPVKRLIVIDGFSVDNTLKIVDEFNQKYGNIKVITESGSRAKARERGIREVETEWFLFVDSDVILHKDWFKKAEKCIDKDVGAIWGLNIDVISNVRNTLLLKFLNFIAREGFKIRGGMHDTLIKRELVKDIKIPEQLHAYEDAYIINWIKKKGYKAVIGDELYCVHLRPPKDWTLRESLTVATLEIKCGLIHSRVLKYIFLYPPLLFYWFLQLVGKNRHFTRTSQKPSKNFLKEWIFQPNRSINVLSKNPKVEKMSKSLNAQKSS